MLIYNYQKEFLGMDESDLEILGYKNLSELRAESADFADMFVKTPGYVHNFKHVHWIDFITCNEYSDNSKVIIHANNKNYRCLLDVKTAFLVDNPSQKAYLIYLTNLRELTPAENEQISGDILERALPISTTESTKIIHTPSDSFEKFDEEELYLDEPTPFNNDIDPLETVKDDYDVKSSDVIKDEYESAVPDTKIDLDFHDEETTLQTPKMQTQLSSDDDFKVDMQEVLETQTTPQEESTDVEIDDDYNYNPEVASKELGLPVDLIEEFIQDFINQAKDFKTPIYEALESNDQDNVKILSHKLKGVAANLRIENAFDVLATINTSNDYNEIRTNLNIFYKIIAKLSQEPYEESQVLQKEKEFVIGSESVEETPPQQNSPKDDDDLVLSFKDEEIQSIDNVQNTPEPEDNTIEAPDFIEDEPIEKELPQEIELVEDEPLIEIDKEEVPETTESVAEDTVEDIIQVKYDKQKIAQEIGIDIESFNELFKDYIFETKMIKEAIEEAIDINDPSRWNAAATKLKGMSEHMRLDLFEEELNILAGTDNADDAKQALHSFSKKFEQI